MSMGIQNETVRRSAGHEKSVIAHGKIFTSERVDSETGKVGTVDVPESIGIVAEHESGATAVYHISTVAHLGYNNMALFGTKASLRYEGNDAFIATNSDKDWQPLEVDKEKEDEAARRVVEALEKVRAAEAQESGIEEAEAAWSDGWLLLRVERTGAGTARRRRGQSLWRSRMWKHSEC